MQGQPDVGGFSAGSCSAFEIVPVQEDATGGFVVMAKNITTETRRMLSFIRGRDVDVIPVPKNEVISTAFEEVLQACSAYMSTIPPGLSVSLEEDLEAMDRGELPSCCQPDPITPQQVQLFGEVVGRYHAFLQTLQTQKS